MKPHPKLRKTIKWGGAAVTVLLVVVWTGSGWWGVAWHGRNGDWAWVAGSKAIIGRDDLTDEGPYFVGWSWRRLAPPSRWKQSCNYQPEMWRLSVPLWAPAVSLGVTAAMAWRLDILARRRERIGRCAMCNYDRTGLSSAAVCPECGTGPAA